MKQCKMCQTALAGRRDKVFCSSACKNEYHNRLREVTNQETTAIDRILHRNRSILLEILGKNTRQKKIPRMRLDKKKFNFSYLTAYHVNNRGKMVHHVYDFSWIIFSDDEVLIARKQRKQPHTSE